MVDRVVLGSHPFKLPKHLAIKLLSQLVIMKKIACQNLGADLVINYKSEDIVKK